MELMRVWYGLRKLTEKAVRNPSIIVIFENEYSHKNDKIVNQMMLILHTRNQTLEEQSDCKIMTRMLSVYEMMFLADKRFKKSPALAIENNFNADSNNVSVEERIVIAEKLRAKVYNFYQIKEPENLQLQLF